jgi:ribonuclease E
MLINAQREAEVRVAVIHGNALEAFEVQSADVGLNRGNIYRGVVANVNHSLNAAFIEYGAERHAFLKSDDIVEAAYHRNAEKGHRAHVEKVLERGRPILVQITKDASGEKGAAATTNLSLAGRYLVLMPFDDARGVSRKVEDEDTRKALIEKVKGLDVPEGFGLIVRTNAQDQNKTTLSRDLLALLRLWKRIQDESARGKGPRLLYSDQDLIVQALRDHLDSSVEEVLVDSDEAYEQAEAYMRAFMPRAKTKLVRYAERMPLFSRFGLEQQIEAIYQRTVPLPSGGSIVIESTEALTTVDVNSGRGTRGANQEENAWAVNQEAAREVARQLRMRDIGGLVVVDFIDMRSHKRQRDLEKVLRDAMKADRARWTVGKISPNGLLEVNRQRIKQALELRTHRECPTCRGAGIIASPEHVSRSLLRRIETAAAAGNLARVRISLHPELADGFQNLQRQEIAALEREFDIRVEVIASNGLHRSEEKIEWFKREWSAAVEAAPVRASDVSDEPAAPAPSRRKRSRRGKAAVEAAPAAAEAEPDEEPEEEQEAAAVQPAGEGGEKRKRRRRGGRKHRKDKGKAKSADEALLPDIEVADLPIEPDSADVFEVAEAAEPVEAAEPAEPGAETSSAAPAGEAKSKRRRRRRRRRPSGDGAAQPAETSEGDDQPFDDAGPESDGAAGDLATPPARDDDQDPF